MDSLVTRREITIRIGNVDLATKLDALGAALAAVREAHRDQIAAKAWAALHRAQENIAEAMMHSPTLPALGGAPATKPQNTICGRRNAPAYHNGTTPAGELTLPAGNVTVGSVTINGVEMVPLIWKERALAAEARMQFMTMPHEFWEDLWDGEKQAAFAEAAKRHLTAVSASPV